MKRLATIGVFALASFVLCGAPQQEEPQMGKIRVYTAKESQLRLKTQTSRPHPGKTKLTNDHWLSVYVYFSPGFAKPGNVRKDGGAKSVRARAGAWADGIKMRVRILYPLEFQGDRNKRVFGVLAGTTMFWTLPLDGKERVAFMMVPPQLLDRYLPLRSSSPGAKEVSAGKNEFMVEAAFFDQQGNELGYGYHNLSINTKGHKDVPEAFEAVCNRAPKASVIEDAVWSKDRTPWGALDFCDYDLVRPAWSRTPSGK